MSIQIRPAELEDARNISELYCRVVGGMDFLSAEFRTHMTGLYDTKKVQQDLTKSGTVTFLAEEESGEIQGVISASPSESTFIHMVNNGLWINWILVAGKHQKKGAGKGLLQTLENHARANGKNGIECVVSVKNTASLAFFERHGYGRREPCLTDNESARRHEKRFKPERREFEPCELFF